MSISHPVFAWNFPFPELPETSAGAPNQSVNSILRIFFPSRNRPFHRLRNWSGTSLASRMHKEKLASESNQNDLAVNNLTTNQSITYGKYNNALSVCRPVNES